MWKEILRGALAGLGATAPMTLAMEAGWRLLPRREQYSLPPREITEEVARKTGINDNLDSQEKYYATVAAHFGYGTAMGGLYGGLVRPLFSDEKSPGEQNLAAGIGWGLTVWTGSYLGLLPGLGILSSATHHPARRNALMIAAHVVWGAALETCFSWMTADEARVHERTRTSPNDSRKAVASQSGSLSRR